MYKPCAQPIYHEVGHWMIAKALGHDGYIEGDIAEIKGFGFRQTTPIVHTIQGLKDQILISFGGIGAEKNLNLPLSAGYIRDLTLACWHLKELREMEKKDFNFSNYMDFPDDEHEYYLSQSKIVLNELGGKDKIIEFGEDVYNQLLEQAGKF